MAVKSSPSEPVLANLDGLLAELETIYKDIHSHPELSMQEERTAGVAADHLRAVGYEVTTGVGKTGVVGLLRNGEGPTVMLRADMDALPVQEATGLPYASKVTGAAWAPTRHRASATASAAPTTTKISSGSERRVSIAARLLSQRAGDETLAHATRPQNENVFVIAYPARFLCQRANFQLAKTSASFF